MNDKKDLVVAYKYRNYKKESKNFYIMGTFTKDLYSWNSKTQNIENTYRADKKKLYEVIKTIIINNDLGKENITYKLDTSKRQVKIKYVGIEENIKKVYTDQNVERIIQRIKDDCQLDIILHGTTNSIVMKGL